VNELLLIRHAERIHARNGLTGAWTDSGLTERGRRQAEATGRRLAELLADRPFAVYASDLRRARETAEIIAGRLQSVPRLDAGLREFNNGQAANMPEEEARRIRVPPPPRREEALDWAPYPGAETWRAMAERVVTCLDRIAQECEGTPVVVTHWAPGQIAVLWWLGLADRLAATLIAFDLDLCSITHLTINRWEERTIAKLNDTTHLGDTGA